MMESLIISLTPYLPYSVVTFILTAISVVGILTYIFQKHLKSPLSPPSSFEKPQEKDLVLKSSKLTIFLSLFGYFPVTPLARSFVKAIEVLRDTIGGVNFRYKLPWFLVIGSENSGKTTFLENINLLRPIGNPMAPHPGEKPGCSWNFFEQGVVIEVDGSYLIQEKSLTSNDVGWRSFFNLLSHFRVRRPLDGVILTIPATELYGESACDTNMLLERSDMIYKKLTLIERKLGLNVPIYIVITKCDTISDFKSFTSALSARQTSQIFGWSSPYAPRENFQGEWVSEAFENIEQALVANQMEIFSQDIDNSSKDGIMLFPQNFLSLLTPLQLYLTNIFKDVGYREAFFCRGIYFTGDTSWQPQDARTDLEKTIPSGQSLASYKIENARKIAFVNQLLQDKVFPEYALAVPGMRRIIASSRAINIMRLMMVGAFFILSFGLWTNYHNLRYSIQELYPVFENILFNLDNKKKFNAAVAQEEDRLFFDESTKTLLVLMSKADHAHFFFWTLPPSWSRSLYKKVQETLSVYTEKIFLHSIYLELQNKANLIIEDPSFFTTTDQESLSLLRSSSFLNLYKYISQLHELEAHIHMYNTLSTTQDLKKLGKIVYYLFKIELPKSIYNNDQFYENALEKINEYPVDLNPLKTKAQDKLSYLLGEFSKSCFSENLVFQKLVLLSQELNNFERQRKSALPSKESLEDLLSQINFIVTFLTDPDNLWINFNTFDPGPEYSELMGMIYESPLFGPIIADSTILSFSKNFDAFKNRLMEISSNLTGPLLNIQNGILMVGPSEPLLQIQTSFSEFLDMPFMQTLDSLIFTTEMPAGAHLYWDAELVNNALDTVNQFNIFLTKVLPTYPPGLQEIFKLMGISSAQSKINSLLAQSQSFVDSSDFLLHTASEENMRQQISNIKTCVPTFITLLESLEASSLDKIYCSLRDLLENQLTQVLSNIDDVFESEGLYEPMNSNFTDWNGEEGAALLAYNVVDEASLKAYLNLARERVTYLATEYAAPILNFLNFKGFLLMSDNISLLTRWTLIFDAVTAYQNRKPGNSILLLQNFILKDMNALTLSNYIEKLGPLSSSDPYIAEDFFAQRLQELETGMLKRCQELSKTIALNHYDQMQTFFNNRLAGKFPFVGNNTQESLGYAEPQDIKEFFELFDSLVVPAKEFLNTGGGSPSSKNTALEFIQSMENVRTFFNSFLTAKNQAALPSYDFEVTFRVNRAHEIGASQILNWVFQNGSQKITLHSPTSSGAWTYGTPISVSFQWTSGGPNYPMTDSKESNLSVTGTTATYTFNSPWAFLELLVSQEAPLTEFSNLTDSNPQTLLFTIPTGGTRTPNNPSSLPAKLFIRIVPKTPEKQGGTVLSLPYFPDSAPVIK